MGMLDVRRAILLNEPHLATATGALISFGTDVPGPMKSLKAYFSADSGGSGLTGLTVYHRGKNLFDAAAVVRRDKRYMGDDGAEHWTSGTAGYTANRTPVQPGTEYTFNGTISGESENWRIYFYQGDTFLNRTNGLSQSDMPYTFTTPANCDGVAFQYRQGVVDFGTFQLEIGDTPTAFAAFNGHEYSVSWAGAAGAAYDGDMDLVTGILTVTDGGAFAAYQLTPETVKALRGANNLWSNAGGNIAADYWTH